MAHDMARSMRFTYWRCDAEGGKFISFFDFLKEKSFIHPLSPDQINELRQNVRVIDCSNCGAPIDLERNSICSFCHSPVAMLDMQQPQRLIAELQQAASKPVDPMLPANLAMATLDADRVFAAFHDDDGRRGSSPGGLVQSGLAAVGRWVEKFVI